MQSLDAIVHLLLTQFGAIATGPGDDIGVARGEQLRHQAVLVRAAQAGSDAAGEEQLPEEVRGVGVGVAGAGRLDARVEADEEDEQVWGDGVGEERQVGVGRGGSVAGGRAGSLLGLGDL